MARNSRLPDELVKEILVYGLHIPFEQFSSGGTTPFAVPDRLSSSVVIVVCKAWLRVATPLLYQTVILRSNAQAAAFDRVIRTNSSFAHYIKQLRLEGAYEKVLTRLIKLNPNIPVFCLYINSFEFVDGPARSFIQALSNIKPTTAIIVCGPVVGKTLTTYDPYSGNLVMLKEALCCNFMSWTTLRYLHTPFIALYRNLHFAACLRMAPNLQEIHLQVNNFEQNLIEHIEMISGNPKVKMIDFQPTNGNDRLCQNLIPQVQRDPYLASIVYFNGKRPGDSVEHPLSSNKSQPLTSTTSSNILAMFDDTVWGNILRHAIISRMDDDVSKKTMFAHGHGPGVGIQGLLTVCKKFRMLGLPHLYRYLVFTCPTHIVLYACRIIQNSSLGQHAKHLRSGLERPVSDHALREGGLSDDDDVMALILRRCPNLHIFDSAHHDKNALSWSAFEALRETSASSLRILKPSSIIGPERGAINPSIFQAFENLVSFKWASKSTFTSSNALPPGTFSKLVHIEHFSLSIRHTRAHQQGPSLLAVMHDMDLPALRTLVASGTCPDAVPFLERHGGKITTLHLYMQEENLPGSLLQYCPATTNLTLTSGKMSRLTAGFLSLFKDCPTREKLSAGCSSASGFHALRKVNIIDHHRCNCINTSSWRLDDSDSSETYSWEKMLLPKVLSDRFPDLREIQINTCSWPLDEREMKSNDWTWLSARLSTKTDIKLTDSEGRHWIPRLGSKGYRIKQRADLKRIQAGA